MKKLTLACCIITSTTFLAGCGFTTGAYNRTVYAPAAYTVGTVGAVGATTVGAVGAVGGAVVRPVGMGFGYPAYYWNTGTYRSYYPGHKYYYAGKKQYVGKKYYYDNRYNTGYTGYVYKDIYHR